MVRLSKCQHFSIEPSERVNSSSQDNEIEVAQVHLYVFMVVSPMLSHIWQSRVRRYIVRYVKKWP